MAALHDADNVRARLAAIETRSALIERVAKIGHWWWTPADNTHFWSPGLYALLNADPETHPPTPNFFESRVHPDDREHIREVFHQARANRISHTARFRLAGDPSRIVAVRGDVQFGADGEPLAYYAVFQDVTERKQAEIEIKTAQERAEAANAAKSRFLANMSHELRTPLNAIIGFADIMRQQMFGYLGSERYAEYTTLIYDSGQLLLDLISDVLDMAKIEAGRLELNYEPIDVGAMVEDCVRLIRERAEKAGLEIRAELPELRISFDADRRSIKQILLNLLSNAIKFTLPGGSVVASARMEGGAVVLGVRDDGIGIPASEIPRLGRPFEQVVADPLMAQSGTGLGLAPVRALAEKHGGSVKIESEEGVGTRVMVRLPTPLTQAVAA